MARTLFFLEAFVLIVVSALVSVVGKMEFLYWLLPFAMAFALPLAAAAAVWPLGVILRAFRQAFSPGRPGPRGPESVGLLDALARFAVVGGIVSSLTATMVLLREIAEGLSPLDAAWQTLAFALLALLFAETTTILRGVVEEALRPPGNADVEAGLAGFGRRYGLSTREGEVAACMVEGRSYKETAERLFISIKTVKTHVSHVYAKTGSANRTALILLLRAETGDSYKRPMENEGHRGDVGGSPDAAKASGTGGTK
jgi:DNA-binding CsgD family transcriptional regulator